jgi:uncharacterized protein YraI
MIKKRSRIVMLLFTSLILFLGGAAMLLTETQPAAAEMAAQLPTVNMATVTSTPFGPFVTVNLDQDQINVRSGPSTLYPKVGVLLAGQTAPAKGRNGDWILIDYAGVPTGTAWVYGPLITITGGALPIIEPPPTPTPLVTATIDATLASQFITTPEFTRLPTYTSAPTIAIPKFSDEAGGGSLPVGWVILFVGLLGIILGLLSLFQGR